MSKLTKLVFKPRLFFRDLRKKRAFVDQMRQLGDRVPAHAINVDAEALENTPQLALARAIASPSVKILSWDYAGQAVFGCLKESVPDLCTRALEIASAISCRLEATAAGRTVPLTPSTRAAIAYTLLEARGLVFNFRSEALEADLPIRFWRRDEESDMIVSEYDNPFGKKLPQSTFDDITAQADLVSLNSLYDHPIDSDCDFEVDIVYTWVNHTDPGWQQLIKQHKNEDDIDWDRFHSSDELRYSLISLARFAPWARRIFLVTNCAPPPWLPAEPRLEIVPHEAIFPDGSDCLPTFNSHAIESGLANIPGLAEHFIYFNDDVFLARPAYKTDFFTGNGLSRSFMEPYGMVVGEPAENQPDYINAAINGRKLIERRFHRSPTQLHRHTPFALKKSVFLEMINEFEDEFSRTRCARFRSISDISSASFLYHHYAYQLEKAVRSNCRSVLVSGANYSKRMKSLVCNGPIQFFCINDGGLSTDDTRFQQAKKDLLRQFFDPDL